MYPRDERLQAIFESAPDAVVSIDPSGQILDWNRSAAQLFGWRTNDLIGKSLAELVLAPDQRLQFNGLLHAEKHGEKESNPKSPRDHWSKISAIGSGNQQFLLEIAVQPVSLPQGLIFAVFFREPCSSFETTRASRFTEASRNVADDQLPVLPDLQLLQELLGLTTATRTCEEALVRSLNIMCDIADWPVGHAWLPDSAGDYLLSSDLWHVRDDPLYAQICGSNKSSESSTCFRLRRGEDLAGRIWESNEPFWSADIGTDSGTEHLRRWNTFGLRGAFGFPVQAHRQTVAVLTFLSPTGIAPEPRLLKWAKTIGAHLGHVLEHRRWETERLHLAAIVDSAYDAIIGKSLDGTIISWNGGAEATYGYSAREAIGQSARILIPEQFGLHEPELADITRYGRQFNQFETVRRRKDGRNIDVTMTVSPIRDTTGHVIGTSSIERDTTHRRRREDELKQATRAAEIASKAKNEFLANVSHELRTPMNAIIGMVDLSLNTDGLAPIVRDYLATASESAHVLLSLLDDLLDFSRMEAGRFELDPQPFSIRQILEEAMRILSLRAHERGLELACDVHPDVPDRLEGDARRIRQIVMNLAGNAIKFTEQGEVVVQVSVQSQQESEVELLLSVRDTGIGIASEDQSRIFAPFTQVDASTTRRFSGTGLGLSICRELVERMGGKIWLESHPGEGTAFYCTPRCRVLPLQHNEDEAIVRELHDLHVLIVDDNATNRRILEQSLHSWSMRPFAVADGRAALQHIEEAVRDGRPYPLLIVDGLMPDLDGFSLIQTLQDRGLTAGAKILMLSPADRNTFEERCRNLPVNAYLEKPVSQSLLLDAVMTALRGPHLRHGAVEKISSTPLALNILVAEDTPANQRVVQAILERRGHHVNIAHNGREAIDLHERAPYDIILMDVQMPTMDGLQATAAIRRLNDDLANVPIIAMTAHAMRGDRERCLAAGMTSYISKPIDANQLVKLVERVSRENRHSRGLWNPMAHKRFAAGEIESSRSTPIQPPINPAAIAPTAALASQTISAEPTSDKPAAARPSTPNPEAPVLNMASALARLGGDQGLLHDMATFFLDDSDQLLKDLQTAIANQESERATRHAHSLKGLAANFNAESCVAVAATIEEAARRGDLTTASEKLSELQHEVARLIAALKTDILK